MSENENVADRTPEVPASLDELASSLLDEARAGDSGHAAVTLTPASGGAFKQTLVAVCEGRSLDPDRWNGPASLQVLVGAASVDGIDGTLRPGMWTVVPDAGAEISAQDDVVALLTVAPDAS
jgi:hypothetical protein